MEARHPLKYRGKSALSPQYVIEKLYELTEGKAIIKYRSWPESDVGSPLL
jgi:hypothetical protein